MPHQVNLPPLNDQAIAFVVEQYYVDVNEPVVAGQAVALVRSERFAWNISATRGGVVGALLIQPGDMVVGGAPLIELRDQRPGYALGANDQAPTTGNEHHPADQNQRLKRPSLVEEPQSDLSLAQPRVRATPVARRMAANHDVDLAILSGTGRGNIITREDVLAVIRNREQAPKGYPGNKEQKIESSLQPSAFSFQPSAFSLPYALTAIEADLGAALDAIAGHKRRARRGVTITITACVAACVAAALGKHRLLNSAWSDDGIILRSRVRLLIEQPASIGTQAALVPDAADLNLHGMARRLAQIDTQQQADSHPATFAIAQRNEPWWSHARPDGMHSAALTIGAGTQQPRVVETAGGDTIALRPVALLVLAYDARVANQREADAFLCELGHRLEHFDRL